MRLRSVLAILVALSFAFTSACGSDEASISEDTSAPSDSGSDDASIPDASDIEDASDALDGVVSEECADWLPVWSSIVGQAFAGELTDEQKAEFEDFKNQVPDEIADDVEVYQEFFDAIADEGLVAAGQLAQSDELNEAGENISAYLEENCTVGG